MARERATAGPSPLSGGSDRIGFFAAALACVVIGVYLSGQNRQEARLRTANMLGVDGRYADAVAEARRVTRPPARARAALVEAYGLRALGRLAEAAAAFRRAAYEDPANWVIRRDYADTLLVTGSRHRARAQLRRAIELNPRMTIPPGFVRPRR